MPPSGGIFASKHAVALIGVTARSHPRLNVAGVSTNPTERNSVAHLYRRAGFGGSPEEVDAATARGYDAAVDDLLRPGPDALADAVPRPPLASTATDADQETTEERIARQKTRRGQRVAIATWWLERMTVAQRPVVEKMTLFWHAHFATSIEKVNEAAFMAAQNDTLRTLGLGRFEPLAQAIAKDPAMMLWLDSNQNKKGSPNENFARELMELFTIGIGAYSDADVREAARAFTGWRINRRTGAFAVLPNQADRQPKSVLGKPVVGGEEVVNLLATSPSAARFVSAKLWSRFATPTAIDAPVVTDLAAVFTSTGGDVTEVMRTLLKHPEFRSVAVCQGLVKQPIEWLVGALRAGGLRPSELAVRGPSVLNALDSLNQVPFAPPSVGGWPQNGYWISTATALSRLKFSQQLSQIARLDWLSSVPGPSRADVLARHLGVDGWTSTTSAALRTANNPKQQFALALVSPEYVLN
jgi:uncharacterized protein (DUF1800 family)